MNTLTNAVLRLEASEHDTPEAAYADLQRAINSGSAWSMQGSFGRSMMDAIKGGYCMLGQNPAHDYYGNRIPSRTEVESGTCGSREFVAERQGEEWAAALEAV